MLKYLTLVAALLTCLGNLGCGGDDVANLPDTVTVKGPVTLDGKPLPAGEIIFDSDADVEKSSTAAGEIKDGKYTLEVTVGKKEVKVISMKKGEKDETGLRLEENTIPAKYNEETTLTAEVTQDGKNEFPFKLESD
jgi:hypothetical protein